MCSEWARLGKGQVILSIKIYKKNGLELDGETYLLVFLQVINTIMEVHLSFVIIKDGPIVIIYIKFSTKMQNSTFEILYLYFDPNLYSF